MLTGTFQRTLDSKMRTTLPAEFRKEFDGKVCLISFNGALYGFTPEGFKAWVDSLFEHGDQHYDPRNLKDVRLRKILTASCQTVDVDAAGRMALGKLGAKTLEALGFKHDVTVIGVFDHFEIWDAAKWEAENAGLEDELFELMFGGSN